MQTAVMNGGVACAGVRGVETEVANETDRMGHAGQVCVRSLFDVTESGERSRTNTSTDDVVGLEHAHARSDLRQPVRGGETRDAAADHDDVGRVDRTQAITRVRSPDGRGLPSPSDRR